MQRLAVTIATLIVVILPLTSGRLFADAPQPHKFEFLEGSEKYYALAVLDPKDNKHLTGFQIFDDKDHLVQLVDDDVDLSNKVPEYILGTVPNMPPVKFVDCNFDGFPDIMLRFENSPRFESFGVLLWNPKQKKFVTDKTFDDLDMGISDVDPKEKRLYSGGSMGHGDFFTSVYGYSPAGKLVLIYTDSIKGREDLEVKTYYSDGKVTSTVKSIPKPEE